jgi:hypothetical protein
MERLIPWQDRSSALPDHQFGQPPGEFRTIEPPPAQHHTRLSRKIPARIPKLVSEWSS